jgi:phage recombination protein Bet
MTQGTTQPKATASTSVMVRMAEKFGMDAARFEQTLMATVIPNKEATREQVAAVLLVADQHGLNPLTKEIYAFPSKGGGVVPIVGYDGWVKLMNGHPAADGIDFEEKCDDQGRLVSCTAIVYRKDRARPTRVTEHLRECIRQTEPWRQWPARMLRNKAAIQGIRLAFGFAGIYDPDEAERIVEVETKSSRVIDVTKGDIEQLTKRLESPTESAPQFDAGVAEQAEINPETGEVLPPVKF